MGMADINELRIYKSGLELVVKVYHLVTHSSQLSKDFSLSDQIKRASVSVPATISEGFCRSRKQFQYYLDISSGSANEVVTLLTIIQLVHHINTEELQEQYKTLGRQIRSFANSFRPSRS